MLLSRSSIMPSGERRADHRRKTYIEAKVQFAGTVEWTRCVVRNISAMGALIEMPTDASVTSLIRLQIPEQLFDSTCEVRQQQGPLVGVEFISGRRQALARFG